ncbi:hypothetical protein EV580_3146 [Mycobacterium sp. BK086]|nr:hypothetical protein EV580_3146 [Mycobacterium sp. BK086]
MTGRRPVAAAYAGGALDEHCSTCGARSGEPCCRIDERTKARVTRAIPCVARIHPGAIQIIDDTTVYADFTEPKCANPLTEQDK